jgi:alpha-glucosidase (family GH31 glycosyl hydrolase)
VRSAQWRERVLQLTLDTSAAADTVVLRLTPSPDRYRLTAEVRGSDQATQVGSNYQISSAGHWYGQGETQTPNGGPYTAQPWPLDSGTVDDPAMGPAEYLMTDPFWFTERGSGLWVDTTNVMHTSLNAQQNVMSYTVTGTAKADSTVFVERTPRAVYQDYIGIAGTPKKSDATPEQYAKPLWNSWAQFYTAVNQASLLKYAQGLHRAGVPGHTIQIDDGWMTHYGDYAFNSKFPDPKRLSEQIHNMGYQFGLWMTLWINTDANNYSYAAKHGYLLRSKTDPNKVCDVQWWNGTAGIVDLANPAAKAWYIGQLRQLQRTYNVDGFKFDTRFFDESCAPYPGYTALDYIKLGANLTDLFDQQGAGVRISWTGSQKYGFVTREIDKETNWNALQVGVAQDMAISTIGYPFVETDMIGGSEAKMPPTKAVLVRWAQAASLMPLMYSSTSPLGVSNLAGSRHYDAQTVALYKAAVRTHERLAGYIEQQVKRAVATGEPIMKPLFFDFPGDRASYTIRDEWLLGDDLLAAPVLTPGTTRTIHLPAGQWFDVLNKRVVTGPTTLSNYRATLSQTPMFVRMHTGAAQALARSLAER